MTDAWRYAVSPDPEIRPFSTAISSPIYNWAGKWPQILKLGHNSLSGPEFFIFVPVFMSRDFEVGSK